MEQEKEWDNEQENPSNRILIVDDNSEIHNDFKKILGNMNLEDSELDNLERDLFESKTKIKRKNRDEQVIPYTIDSAYSGEEAISMVEKSLKNEKPYTLIFMDVRMFPGLNGVEAIKKIWELSRNIEVVICTAYSDYSWDEIIEELGSSDHLLFLKKPFNTIEIKQMALALVKKWNLHNQLRSMINNLEKQVLKRTEELERVNRDLQKAHDQKTRFFVNLAHETRTPLTLIQNYLEKYISKTGFDTDLQVLKQNIDTLVRNMVNFLDAEKLRRGQIFFNHNQAANISKILKNKIILFKEIAKNINITITETIEDALYVKADPYAVDRIINNIIDNSIKYSEKGGRINVILNKKDDLIVFRVKDSGIGMTKKQLEYIFMPYYQLSHKKSNLQGIGMGLYIVKRVADAINAEIKIESTPGQGTNFMILFPYCNPVHSGLKEHSFKGDNNLDCIIPPPAGGLHRGFELHEKDIQPGKKNILLVDDNVEMLYFLQTFLKNEYNVFLAKNVKEALEKLKSLPVLDIIISDIMMDEMDGYAFFSHLKETDEHSDVPFIFLTAKSSMEEKLKGLSEGAVDYIYKPFLIKELAAKIESTIKNREKLKEKHKAKIQKQIKEILKTMREQKTLHNKFLLLDNLGMNYNLSNREKQVIILLLEGCVNKEISDRLHISLRTVEFHLGNIYKKLKVKNKIELVNLLNP